MNKDKDDAVAQGTPMDRDELFARFGKEFSATTWMAQKFAMGSKVIGDKEAYDVLAKVVALSAQVVELQKEVAKAEEQITEQGYEIQRLCSMTPNSEIAVPPSVKDSGNDNS